MQYATDIRDARNDVIESVVGPSPIVRVFSGPLPANPAAALSASNKLLAQGTLPSDWMTSSSGGTKTKAGTWTLTGQADAGTGTAGTFIRFYESTGTTCKVQARFGLDQEVVPANNSISSGQPVIISTFSINEGNP